MPQTCTYASPGSHMINSNSACMLSYSNLCVVTPVLELVSTTQQEGIVY